MAKKDKNDKKELTKADIDFQEQDNNTFEIEVTIPWEEIEDTYDKVLKELAKNVDAKGFRKGKVPADVAEEKIGKEHIFQHVIQKIIPPVYQKAIQDNELKPVASPNVQPIKVAKDNDWVLKIISCEAPEVDLKGYKKKVKKVIGSSKLWTPDQGKPKKKDEKNAKEEYNKKLNKVMETLLEHVDVDLSEFLVKRETNRSLSRFMDQLEKMGVELEDYMESKNIDSKQLREQHEEQTKRTLKLEFILQEIIQEEDIKVDEKEINKTIANVKDEKTKKRLDTPAERAYLSSILAKRKAIDFLLNL
jgi:FKBP-type peptidyl-prolyl cis-trans isomerase (trigger factor)